MSTCSNTLELRSVDIVDHLALPFFTAGSIITLIKGINAGVAMLWVPLDDALYISGSLGVLNFLKIAMKRDILIKDGRALETLYTVDTLVFNQSTLIEETSSLENTHIKDNATKIISQLRKLGYKLCIFSDNDQTASTQDLVQQLDIDHYFFDVSVQEKVNLIKEMQEKGQKVCYIESELHDPIVLQQADVSVSLQNTSTVISGAAQIILMNRDLEQLIDLLELAKSLNKTHKTNLVAGAIPSLAIVGGVLTVQISIPTAILYYIAGMSISLASVTLPLLKENYRNKKRSKQ
jgi:cation transport ATPase